MVGQFIIPTDFYRKKIPNIIIEYPPPFTDKSRRPFRRHSINHI